MTRENKIEAYLVREVKRRGGLSRKVKWIGVNGAPDRLIWIPDWGFTHALVELKALGKSLESHQIREHDRLRKMGFIVHKIDACSQVDDLLNRVSNFRTKR